MLSDRLAGSRRPVGPRGSLGDGWDRRDVVAGSLRDEFFAMTDTTCGPTRLRISTE